MSNDNGQDVKAEAPVEGPRIDPEINKRISAFRAAANTHRVEIGQLEIRKFQLLTTIAEIERQAQGLMKHELERIGIPEGAQWGLRDDGTVVLAGPTGPAQVAPPAAG